MTSKGLRMDDCNDIEEWLRNRPTLTEERNHPNHWYNRASDLRASAGALWYAMNHKEKEVAESLSLGSGFSMSVACWPVYHMICGLSLELILKAVIVSRGIQLPHTHDLNALASKLGIEKTPYEKRLLSFYKASIEWAGRYPIPKKCEDDVLVAYWESANDILMTPCDFPKIDGVVGRFKKASGATDWEHFDPLWRKFSSMFVREH